MKSICNSKKKPRYIKICTYEKKKLSFPKEKKKKVSFKREKIKNIDIAENK
jgi:hypothetical protein